MPATSTDDAVRFAVGGITVVLSCPPGAQDAVALLDQARGVQQRLERLTAQSTGEDTLTVRHLVTARVAVGHLVEYLARQALSHPGPPGELGSPSSTGREPVSTTTTSSSH